ncbi:unnamed protein product [Moneuplotes crassus]|uniref:protein-serine/threonine phosphatase n=1 Tax=Euplotes crassus TaxID=5936 RepID=A0AAD1X643_EUPCR|nr:unnamed protein product [Moneuplotes crassus]
MGSIDIKHHFFFGGQDFSNALSINHEGLLYEEDAISVKEFTVIEKQGRRPKMEDTYLIVDRFRNNPEEGLYCIFDGHSSDHISKYLANNFSTIFEICLNKTQEVIENIKNQKVKSEIYEIKQSIKEKREDDRHYWRKRFGLQDDSDNMDDEEELSESSSIRYNKEIKDIMERIFIKEDEIIINRSDLRNSKMRNNKDVKMEDIKRELKLYKHEDEEENNEESTQEEEEKSQDIHDLIDVTVCVEQKMDVIMTQTFEYINSKIINNLGKSSGSTAVVIYITKEEDKKVLYCANCGDSMAFLVNQTSIEDLCGFHHHTNLEEKKRIRTKNRDLNTNKEFDRVGDTISVTRAFGDRNFSKFGLICTPDVKRIELAKEHKFCIITSDGITDKVTTEDIYKISLKNEESLEICTKITNLAHRRGTTDNTTCCVLKPTISSC